MDYAESLVDKKYPQPCPWTLVCHHSVYTSTHDYISEFYKLILKGRLRLRLFIMEVFYYGDLIDSGSGDWTSSQKCFSLNYISDPRPNNLHSAPVWLCCNAECVFLQNVDGGMFH